MSYVESVSINLNWQGDIGFELQNMYVVSEKIKNLASSDEIFIKMLDKDQRVFKIEFKA